MESEGNSKDSSSKRKENGDKEPDRPFKKARFAWQVKGKYHLKTESNDVLISSDDNQISAYGDDSSSDSSSEEIEDTNGNTEQNLEILGDYLLKRDFDTLNPSINNSDGSEKTNNRDSLFLENNESNRSHQENSATISFVNQMRSLKEDQCLARWQARQIAKGFVDNTINRVLDSWLVAPIAEPLEPLDGRRNVALDVAEFINNLPATNTVENEGILMAISAHGLQNTSNSNSENEHSVNESSGAKQNINSLQSDSESDSDMEYSTVKNIDKTRSVWMDPPERCSCSNATRNNISDVGVALLTPFRSRDSSPYDPPSQMSGSSSTSKLGRYEDSNFKAEQGTVNDFVNKEEVTFDDSFDFMDTAVAFAIQDKGLTSLGSG